jgi:hypothetical protein
MNGSTKTGARPLKRSSRSAADSDWREGTVQDFLGLTDEEAQLIRTKAALAVMLQQRRQLKGWSQTVLAERLGSGQSRIAKIEAAHPSVSLDLLVKALLVAGATMPEIGAVMASGHSKTEVGGRPAHVKPARRGR